MFRTKKVKPIEEEPEDFVNSIDINTLTMKDFNRILKFGKSQDFIGKYKSIGFLELPYGLIKRELKLLQKQEKFYEMIEAVLKFQYPNLNLSKASGNEQMAFLLWIREQLEFINAIELNYLSSDPDPKMVAAGIMELDELEALPTIDQLAQGNILNYQAIEALPYYRVYEKLKLEKKLRDINQRYEEIVKNAK